LRGYDPADTIEEKGGSAGRAGEWVNKKAGAGATAAAAGTTGAAAFASTRAAAAQPDVRWHERPEHCGWQGVRLQPFNHSSQGSNQACTAKCSRSSSLLLRIWHFNHHIVESRRRR
jgi:hypothetical protein